MNPPDSATKQSRQHADTDTIDQYLDSMPDLRIELRSLRMSNVEATSETYERITALILRYVRQSLDDTYRAKPKWMSDLIAFNYDNEDDARFITNLLVGHATQNPWIIEGPFWTRMSSAIQSLEGLVVSMAPEPEACPNPICHFGFPHLRWQHGEETEPGASERSSARVGTRNGIDASLGIAGLIPLRTLQTYSAGSSITEPSNLESNMSIEVKEASLRELRAHCHVETSRHLLISFGSYDKALHRIKFNLPLLMSAIKNCKSSGRWFFGIPIIRRAILGPGETPVLSMDRLEVKNVVRFADCFRVFEQAFEQAFGQAHRSSFLPVIGAISAGSSFNWVGRMTAASVSVWQPFSNRLATSRRLVLAMKEVLKSLRPIFRIIAPELADSNIEETLEETLHYSSLAIQCISLAVQSAARNLLSPMDFPFLEDQVDDLTLEGAKGTSIICATRQSLSCLGDMLDQDVMTFGTRNSRSSERMDLVASLRDVLSAWGPGKLTAIHSHEDVEDNTSHPTFFREAYIGGGVLRPSIGSVHTEGSMRTNSPSQPSIRFFGSFESNTMASNQSKGYPRWHWSSLETVSVPNSQDGPHQGQVDLDTKIRIGTPDHDTMNQVDQRPCAIVFDAPSQENRDCPHSDWASDVQRRQSEAGRSSLKCLGTHGDYSRFAGHDMGFQFGQHLLPQFMMKWDNIPGTSLKTQILLPNQCTSDLLRRLDDTCGLLVSSCTKVMARVRLRDLVAFIGPLIYPQSFPVLKDLELEDSREQLVSALQGREDITTWAEGRRDHEDKYLSTSETLKKLILDVLTKLKPTGVLPPNNFEAAWLSQSSPDRSVRVSCAANPGLLLFKDGEHTATFACITPACLVTQIDACESQSQDQFSFSSGLSDFTLSTRLLPYKDLALGNESETFGTAPLQQDKMYYLNSMSSRVIARVERELEQGVFLIKITTGIERSEQLLKRIVVRGKMRFLRETSDYGAIPCLISAR